ncbi:hypothetical protein DA798_08235 [Lactobacillus sp. PFC-70]|nr:hypothetical protein DA798_08235 [Lactobacillus sp. PFC-70]
MTFKITSILRMGVIFLPSFSIFEASSAELAVSKEASRMMWKKWIWGLSVAIAGVWGSFGAVTAHADGYQVNYRILALNSDGSQADYIYKTVKVKRLKEVARLEKLTFMNVTPQLSPTYHQDGQTMADWIYDSRQRKQKVNVVFRYPKDLVWKTAAEFPTRGGYVLPHPIKGYQVQKIEGNQRFVQEEQTVKFTFEVLGSGPVEPSQRPELKPLPELPTPEPGAVAEPTPDLATHPTPQPEPGASVNPAPQPHPVPIPVVPAPPVRPTEPENQRPEIPDSQSESLVAMPSEPVQPFPDSEPQREPIAQYPDAPVRPTRLPHTVFSPTAVTAAATGHASRSKRTRRPAQPAMDGTSTDSVAHALDWPEVPATDGSSQHGSRAKHSQAQSANRLPQTSEQAPTTWAWGGLLALGSLVGYRYRRLRH